MKCPNPNCTARPGENDRFCAACGTPFSQPGNNTMYAMCITKTRRIACGLLLLIFLVPLPLFGANERGVRVNSRSEGQALHREFSDGKNHALVIGIDRYAHHPDLNTAVKDAGAVANVLAERYFFDRDDILLLTGEKATKAGIMNAFRDLATSRAGKGDNVFVYYAGHGWYDEVFDAGYWVTGEATKEPATFLSNDTVYRFITALDKKGARHVLLVSDSCFSGSFTRDHRTVEIDIDDRYFRQKYAKPSRSVISSGGLEPVDDGGRGGHSIFAYYFLQTLRENRFPYLSAKQVGARVEELVTRNALQTPVSRFIHGVGDEGGQFFFISSRSTAAVAKVPAVQTSVLPAPPSPGNIGDLDDVIRKRRAVKKKWSEWQGSMQENFTRARGYDGAGELKPPEKVQVWQRFLAAFSADNPHTEDDGAMRQTARERLAHWQAAETLKVKPPAPEPVPVQSSKPGIPKTALRSEPKTVSEKDIKAMLQRHGFFEAVWNKSGEFKNDFKDNGDGTVTDRATWLMWQKGGSDNYIPFKEAREYIADLNRQRFAGHADWRLPTLEELCSLVESRKINGNLFIDPVFDKEQRWCWSADGRSSDSAWLVYFDYGRVDWAPPRPGGCVRAVRSWQ